MKTKMNSTSTTGTNPTKLQRYHHPSHPHKLFQSIIRNQKIFCDNLNCTRRIMHNEVSYVCFRCNFDLCSRCFELPTDPESQCALHESDQEINEDVHFFPSRYANVVKSVRIHQIEEKNEAVANGPMIRPHTASQESSNNDDEDGGDGGDGGDDSDDSDDSNDSNDEHLSRHEMDTPQPQQFQQQQTPTQSQSINPPNQQPPTQAQSINPPHQQPPTQAQSIIPSHQPQRELVLTFHNENFDELTSERINTFINQSRGEFFIRSRTHQ